jgi:hypothetical protein
MIGFSRIMSPYLYYFVHKFSEDGELFKFRRISSSYLAWTDFLAAPAAAPETSCPDDSLTNSENLSTCTANEKRQRRRYKFVRNTYKQAALLSLGMLGAKLLLEDCRRTLHVPDQAKFRRQTHSRNG